MSTRNVNRVVAQNLLLMVLLGGLLSGWLLRFTEWFEIVGGVIALAGGFVWLGALFRVLPESVVEDLRNQLYDRFVNQVGVAGLLWLLLLAVAVASFFTAGIRLESPAAFSASWAYVYAPGEERGDPVQVPPGKSLRLPIWKTPLERAERVVKIDGLPAYFASIGSLERHELHLPQALQRRVVLAVPDPSRLSNHEPIRLEILVDGRVYEEVSYEFDAIWIGCSSDVTMPESVRRRLADRLPEDKRAYQSKWMQPRSLPSPEPGGGPVSSEAGEEFQLKTGSEIVVKMHFESFDVCLSTKVRALGDARDFVQVWSWEEDDNECTVANDSDDRARSSDGGGPDGD